MSRSLEGNVAVLFGRIGLPFVLQHLERLDDVSARILGKIHGIDISSKSINVAMKKAVENNVKNITYKHADIFDENYNPESFDAILSFSVLHLIKNPYKVLKRIHEMLIPEGLFISATPCLGEGGSPLGICLYLLSKTPLVPYVGKYKPSELASLIAEAGFEIVRTDIIKSMTLNSFIVGRKI